MARSKWKFFYFNKLIWKKLYKLKKKKKKNFKTIFFDRSTNIPLSFEKNNIHIHKGNFFRKFKFRQYFLGIKLGEFAFTKKPFYFPQKKKKR